MRDYEIEALLKLELGRLSALEGRTIRSREVQLVWETSEVDPTVRFLWVAYSKPGAPEEGSRLLAAVTSGRSTVLAIGTPWTSTIPTPWNADVLATACREMAETSEHAWFSATILPLDSLEVRIRSGPKGPSNMGIGRLHLDELSRSENADSIRLNTEPPVVSMTSDSASVLLWLIRNHRATRHRCAFSPAETLRYPTHEVLEERVFGFLRGQS